MKKKFLYFLVDKDDKSFVLQNGTVQKTALWTPLKYSPLGFNEQILKWSRNNTYIGIFPSYSLPLKFIKDAAHIIRNQLYGTGLKDSLFLIIWRLNKLTGKHEFYYKGEIDFIKPLDTKDYFEVNLTEYGFFKNLKAYENTTFDVPLAGGVDIQLDGLNLQITTTFAAVTLSDTLAVLHTIPLVLIKQEGTSFNILMEDQTYENANATNYFKDSSNFIAKNVGPTNLILPTIKGTIVVRSDDHIGGIYGIGYNISSDTVLGGNHALSGPGVAIVSGEAHEFTYNLSNITLTPGQKLFLFGYTLDSIGSGPKAWTFGATNIAIQCLSRFKTTTTKALSAFDLGQALINKMMRSTEYTLDSTLLKNCGLYLTSGNALRGIAGASITTNWKAFFTSMDLEQSIGLDVIKKVVYIGPKENFYDNTSTTYDLGEVASASFAIREDLLFSALNIGYQNQTYDDVNGKDEFNNTAVFTLPNNRVTTVLTKVAPYRADPYGIEFTRINLENLTTTDSSSDKNTFMLDVVYDAVHHKYILNRPAYTSITGVLSPTTIYNTRLSPANLVYKNGAWLRSGLWKFDTDKILFQTTDKNGALSVSLAGVTITENADININSLKKALFIPIEAKVKLVVPDALSTIMANKYGKFKFSWLGNTYFGFVTDASQKPFGNEEQEWLLLLAPDTNLLNLIHG